MKRAFSILLVFCFVFTSMLFFDLPNHYGDHWCGHDRFVFGADEETETTVDRQPT